jgi:hypothetical protein
MATALSEPLQRAYETIRDLLAEAGRVDVRTRHAIGAVIVEVKRSKHKYGARAVLQLSDALGTDEQTLYRCAGVAACWTPSELDALLARTTPLGQPLTWSHFVLLSTVESSDVRAALFERSVREGLSVRTLSSLVEGDPSSKPSLPSIDGLVRTTERLLREMATAHGELLSRLVASPRDAEAREAVEHVIAATERLRALLQAQSEQLIAQYDGLPPRPSERPVARALAGMA